MAKNNLFLLGLLGLSLCLTTACSSDDDDNGQGGETPPPSLTDKKLTGIYDNEGSTWSNMKYDGQGQLVAYTENDNELSAITYTYAYAKSSISVTATDKANHIKSRKTFYINSDRRIERAEWTGDEIVTITYTYDDDNQITRVEAKEKSGKQTVVTFGWKSGNIESVKEESSWGSSHDTDVTLLTYGTQSADKFLQPGEAFEYLDGALFRYGYFGKYIKHLPQTKEEVGEKTETYTYEFDKDGYVTRLEMSGGYSATFIWK